MPKTIHWNPIRREVMGAGPFSSKIPVWRRVNNFGDLLGPLIVDRIVALESLPENSTNIRLLSVGSILRLAQPSDVVWGSGINGKTLGSYSFPPIDVRAVRGPKTASILRDQKIKVPNVFGDPALLIPILWTDDEIGISRRSGSVVFAPNLNDLAFAPPGSLNPRGNPWDKIRKIAEAQLVVASSLHAIVIAEAYGVPAVLVASPNEHIFKYEDYFTGTGRKLPELATNWKTAEHTPTIPALKWDSQALYEAFPRDLWRK